MGSERNTDGPLAVVFRENYGNKATPWSRRVTRVVGRALYVAGPLLSIGSFAWFVFFQDLPWYASIPLATIGLFGFAFLGMVGGQLADRSQ
jgi:hypothetical protein